MLPGRAVRCAIRWAGMVCQLAVRRRVCYAPSVMLPKTATAACQWVLGFFLAAAFWLPSGRLAAVGPEDDFWSAPVLTGFTHEISASILGATPSTELLGFEEWGGPVVDLWWQVVMPVDGILEAHLAGLDPQDLQHWRLELRTGEFPTGRRLGYSEGANSSLGRAAGGQRVHARVRMNQSRLATVRGTDFRLVLRVWPMPANQTLDTAMLLEGTQFDQAVDYAGTEPIWFRWVAPQTEWFRLSQSGTSPRLAMSSVNQLAGNPANAAFFSTHGITFLAEAGQAYWFGLGAASPLWSEVGAKRISLRPVLPEAGTEAANDARDRATQLTGDRWTLTGDSTFATGDLSFAQELLAATGETAGGRDLWWRWVAPAEGDLVIDRAEPYFAGGLWIRRPGAIWMKWRWDSPRTQVVAGEALEFAVDGERWMLGNGLWDVTPGPFTFSGRFLPRPTNDRWAAAEPLTGAEVSWEVPDDGSVAEPGSPVDAGRWWRWVPPRDGVAWCRFVETSSPPLTRWFSGDSLDALAPVPPDWSPFFSTPHLAYVKAGATYWLWLPKPCVGRVELRLLNPATNTAPESARPLAGIFNEVEQENLSTLATAAHWFRWTAPATGTFMCRTVGANWENIGSPLPTVLTQLDLFREKDLGGAPHGAGVGVRPFFVEDRARFWWALAVTAGETVWIRATLDGSTGMLGYPWLGRHQFEAELVPFRLVPTDSAAFLTAGADQRFQVETLDGWQTNSITRILDPDDSVLGNGLPFETEFHVPAPRNTYVVLKTEEGRTLVAASPDLPIHPAGDSFASPIQTGNWKVSSTLAYLENAGPDPGSPADLAPGVWLAWHSLFGGPARLSLTGTNLVATVFRGTNLNELRTLARMETGRAGNVSNGLTVDAGTELRIHVGGPTQSGPRGFVLTTESPTEFQQSMPPPGTLRAGDAWEFHLPPPVGATPTPRVEFVADNVLVATLTAPPWRWVWTNLSPGYHSIGARLIGAAGDVVEFPASGAAASFVVGVTNDTFARRVMVTGDQMPPGWAEWTPPATGLLELHGPGKAPMFVVTSGQVGPPVSYLGEPLWQHILHIPVQAGTTYALNLDHSVPFRLLQRTPADYLAGAIRLADAGADLVMPSLPGTLDEDEAGLATNCPEIVQSLWWRWRAPTNGWLSFVPGPALEAVCHQFAPLYLDDRLEDGPELGRRRWLVTAGREIDLRLLLPPVTPGAVLGRLQFEAQGILKSFRFLEDGAAEFVWHPFRPRDTWLGSATSVDSGFGDWRRIIRLADEEFVEDPDFLVVTNRIRLPANESGRFFRIEFD